MKRLINRTKMLIISPVSEWKIIKDESLSVLSLLLMYVVPFMFLTSIFSFIIEYFIYKIFVPEMIVRYVTMFFNPLIPILLTSIALFFVKAIFDLHCKFSEILKLVIFSLLPFLVIYSFSSFFSLHPLVGVLGIIIFIFVGLYTTYILYIGTIELLVMPKIKVFGFVLTSSLLFISIFLVYISLILPMIGLPF